MSRHARDEAADPGQWFRVVAGKPGPDERLFFRIPAGDTGGWSSMGGWSSIVENTPGPGPIVVGTPHDRHRAARQDDQRVVGTGWVLL